MESGKGGRGESEWGGVAVGGGGNRHRVVSQTMGWVGVGEGWWGGLSGEWEGGRGESEWGGVAVGGGGIVTG